MKANGDYEVSDVPRLLQQWRDSGGHRWDALLAARGALADACNGIMENADTESRALTADERRKFDFHAEQIRAINSDLAEFKRGRLADLASQGISAAECRLPW